VDNQASPLINNLSTGKINSYQQEKNKKIYSNLTY